MVVIMKKAKLILEILDEYTHMGYDWNNLHNWILSIETGYSTYEHKLCIAK